MGLALDVRLELGLKGSTHHEASGFGGLRRVPFRVERLWSPPDVNYNCVWRQLVVDNLRMVMHDI